MPRKRLDSTKNIFNNKNATALFLAHKADRQITADYHRLNAIRGALKRASRPQTIKKISARLNEAAYEMGLNPTTTKDKAKLLDKITRYQKQNSFLHVAALDQAIIGLCSNYEDFVRRIIVKYYEEDIRRLMLKKQSVSSKFLVQALMRGDNIHHSLAEQVAGDVMYGSIDEWYRQLQVIGMSTSKVPPGVKEVFLIRHCLIHNNNRVSSTLHESNPSKYPLRATIVVSLSQVEAFKTALHESALHMISEYNRLFPTNTGTWLPNSPSELTN